MTANLRQFNLISAFPYGGSPSTATPTAWGATVMRIFPFFLPARLRVNVMLLRSNGVVSACLIGGIFNEFGAQVYQTGALDTVATSWIVHTPTTGFVMEPGWYYYGQTNNNVTSVTAAYTVAPAHGSAALPRSGTYSTSAGAMPSSITPSSITPANVLLPAYVLLSEYT